MQTLECIAGLLIILDLWPWLKMPQDHMVGGGRDTVVGGLCYEC